MKKYAVIGNPIAQSKSPAMYRPVFQKLGIDASFEAIEVTDLATFPFLDYAGLCVTIPHKVEVMRYLDEVDYLAKQSGAVNVVVHQNGKLKGYNTDGRGLVHGLPEGFEQRKILVIGAGGASRGIVAALRDAGAKQITVANRTLQSGLIALSEAEERLPEFEIVIQTTSVGMFPDVNASPISLQNLLPGTFVCDIVYNPVRTKFLQEAERQGAVTQSGIEMFVNQGVLAFEYWTGQRPDRELMRKAVEGELGC